MRSLPRLTSISCLAITLVAAGCSSGSPSQADADANPDGPPAGVGGTNGGGGSGGRDGGAGAAADAAVDQRADALGETGRDAGTDGFPLGACLGVCLETLLQDCQKAIGCTSAASGSQTDLCYVNGVRERQTTSAAGIQGTVKRADGSVCYSYLRTTNVQSYFDAQGQPVGQLTAGATDLLYTATCSADPAPRPVDLGVPACAERRAISLQTCTPGACTF